MVLFRQFDLFEYQKLHIKLQIKKLKLEINLLKLQSKESNVPVSDNSSDTD